MVVFARPPVFRSGRGARASCSHAHQVEFVEPVTTPTGIASNRALWDDGAPATYPRLQGRVDVDACVVGLGASGLACIDELRRSGLTVAGVDAGTVGGAAAGRNGGLLRAGGSLFHHQARARYGPVRAQWLYRSTAAERERVLQALPRLARRAGYLRLAHDAAELEDCRAHGAALAADGVPVSWYDGALGAGLVVPDDAVIDPRARCRLEAAHLQAAGARLFEQSRVESIAKGQVDTADGRITCRAVVVAVDGALPLVLPELASRVQPMRLQMLASAGHPAGLLPHALGTRWGWDYGQQLGDGRIAFGGCRDVGGEEEETTDSLPTDAVQAAIEVRFGEVLGVAPRVTHRWAATVCYTEDGLPIVDEVRPGVWACGAYSGTGNLLGAVCGRLAAQLATGVRTDSPLG